MKAIPTICVTGLSDELLRAFTLADNKFSERAGWNREILASELEELSILLPSLDLYISLTGFEFGEIDVLLADIGEEKPAPEDRPPPTAGPKVARGGDLWILRQHRVLCGDAREASDYVRLMKGELTAMVFTDPPYNVRIGGHVQGRGRVKHDEFAGKSLARRDELYPLIASLIRAERTHRQARSITAPTGLTVSGLARSLPHKWINQERMFGLS